MGLNFAINSEKDTVYLENRIEAFINVGKVILFINRSKIIINANNNIKFKT